LHKGGNEKMDENEYYFKIGEMAEMFDISVRTLHLYDRMKLFQPEYTDEETGYRYYSTNQVNKLNTILSLKSVGFSLKEIMDMINRKIDATELSRMLQLKLANTQKKIDTLLFNIDALDGMIVAVEKEKKYVDRLTEQEKANVMSKIACLENIKFENFITSIFWL
jgi:DNA-binding transcriptional MerR regulator